MTADANVELEVKLTLKPDALCRARDVLADQAGDTGLDPVTLRNVYYDTPVFDLSEQRMALRLREKGSRYIQTLKTQGEFVDGGYRRMEWEWPLQTAKLDLALLAETPLSDTVNLHELLPVFETNFEREVFMITESGPGGEALVEVAIDQGRIISGDRFRSLCEVEFELKSGNPAILQTLASRLADEVPVFLNLVSKAEQGYYLAGLYEPVLKSTAGSELAVNDFLFFLSVSWLTGGSISFDQQELAAISRLAARRGVNAQYHHVVHRLAGGSSVQSLLSGNELGQLQLAIASDD